MAQSLFKGHVSRVTLQPDETTRIQTMDSDFVIGIDSTVSLDREPDITPLRTRLALCVGGTAEYGKRFEDERRPMIPPGE